MMKYCPVTGVNIKRFALSLIAGFAFTFAYDFVVHGNLMMGLYQQTPQLWRTPEDMQAYLPFMMMFQFLTVFVTALIFTRNYEGRGVMEGVRYGLLIGLLMGIMMAAPYAWMPISGMLSFMGFVCGVVLGIGQGVIYALTYRK